MEQPTKADLKELVVVGKVHLPQMAVDYQTAIARLRAATSAPCGEGAFAGKPFEALDQRWFDTCKTLEDSLVETESVLSDASQAIGKVVRDYGLTDAEAAEAIAAAGGSPTETWGAW